MRQVFLLALALMLIVLASCSPSGGDTDMPDMPETEYTTIEDGVPDVPPPMPEPSRVFLFADSRPDEHTADEAFLKFRELISELSGGEWEVRIYSRETYTEDEIIDMAVSGKIDFARIPADAFDEYETASDLAELSRFDDSVIITGAILWESMSPEEQSIVMQCALEVAIEYLYPQLNNTGNSIAKITRPVNSLLCLSKRDIIVLI